MPQYLQFTPDFTFKVSPHCHLCSCICKHNWCHNQKPIEIACMWFATQKLFLEILEQHYMGRAKRIWYLSPMRAAKVQASLRIRAVSPEPPLLAHTSSESNGTFRQKARSLALLNGWACAVKLCHDGMLEDTNSLDGAHMSLVTRKPVFRVSDHGRLAPACSAAETS